MTTPFSARMMHAIRCRVSGSRTRAEVDGFLIEHPLHAECHPTLPEWHSYVPKTPPIIGCLDDEFEIAAPVTTFDKLTLLERDEIETMRGIHNLLALYRAQTQNKVTTTPISIAVFGPPGSGKSFAVKQIAGALGNEIVIPRLEFNVSQFSSVGDLKTSFDEVLKKRKEAQGNVTPLAFFDEFDCAVHGGDRSDVHANLRRDRNCVAAAARAT